jgi:hypothetical protein
MKFKVKLIRGPKPTKTWEHETRAAAERRAWALAELHSARVSFDADSLGQFRRDGGTDYTVDASAFYTKVKR